VRSARYTIKKAGEAPSIIVVDRLVAWDEFSMLGVDHFDMSDMRLRQAKNEPDLDFGGLGISLSGDLLQLKPIGKPSFAQRYTEPTATVAELRRKTSGALKQRKRRAGIVAKEEVGEEDEVPEQVYEHRAHAQRGDATYLTFKTVISLDVNLRAPGVLGDLQAAMRRGDVTQDLWDIYASRKLTSAGAELDPRLNAPPFSNNPIHYIVQRHKLRVQLSLDNAIMHCVEHKKRLYCVVASDRVSNHVQRRHFTPEVRAELQAVVKPSALEHLPGLCFLYIGMRVLLFDKVCVRLGLVNGCECVVEHIVFAEEEDVPGDGALVAGRPHTLQYMPNALLLRAVGVPWQLPVGELPNLPDHITDRRGLFILNPSQKNLRPPAVRCLSPSKGVSITVTRVQFPVEPADVCIVYGAQGQSWDAVIADMERAPRWSLDDHWLSCYVMISRARTLEGLLLLRLATREELNRGAPAYLLAEIDRLLALENESTKALEAYIRTLQCVVPPEILKLFVTEPVKPEEATAPLLGVRRRITSKRPLDQACTDEASVQRPRQQPPGVHQSPTAKRPLTLATDASTKRSRVFDAPCESTAATSHVAEDNITRASEETAVDQLARIVEESTERTTVDVVAPTLNVFSGGASFILVGGVSC
jgi:hypothetical protein